MIKQGDRVKLLTVENEVVFGRVVKVVNGSYRVKGPWGELWEVTERDFIN